MKYRVVKANDWDILSTITAPVMTNEVIKEALEKLFYKVQFKKYLIWRDCKKDNETILFDKKELAERYLYFLEMRDCGMSKDLMKSNYPLDPEISKYVDDHFWDLI